MTKRSTGWLCALLAGVAAVGIVSVPTSLAFLQSSEQRTGVTLTSGTPDLSITVGSGGAPKVAPTPGFVFINGAQPDRITNTGDAPLRLSVLPTASTTATDTIGGWLLLNVSATAGSCLEWDGTLWTGMTTSNTVTPDTVILQPGATLNLCIGYTLQNDAPTSIQNSAPTSFSITVTGTQVPR